MIKIIKQRAHLKNPQKKKNLKCIIREHAPENFIPKLKNIIISDYLEMDEELVQLLIKDLDSCNFLHHNLEKLKTSALIFPKPLLKKLIDQSGFLLSNKHIKTLSKATLIDIYYCVLTIRKMHWLINTLSDDDFDTEVKACKQILNTTIPKDIRKKIKKIRPIKAVKCVVHQINR